MSDMNSKDQNLDRLLKEASAAEVPVTVDATRFLARLRSRPTSPRWVSALPRPLWLSAAALVPLALLLWAMAPWSTSVSLDAAILDELDLLELLSTLEPAEIATLDPDLIDFYADLEIVEELPVDLLGVSE
ncbi:MAG TPA: hypothetical protein EYN79_08200 [Planctomycetes bacterium]|nr:hypothetical protein [Planctomycetota bacterium]HIN79964.1 hypothetical protein [Planctomycetota bacterium]